MQENAGSVETTAAVDSDENNQNSKKGKAKKAKSKKPRSKEVKIPTVNAIVEKEEERENTQQPQEQVVKTEEDSPVKTDETDQKVSSVSEESSVVEVEQEDSISAEKIPEVEQENSSSTEKVPEVDSETVSESADASTENDAAVSDASEDDEKKALEERKAIEDSIPDEIDEEAQEVEEEDISTKRAALDLDGETALVETVLFLESESQTVESLAKITQFSVDVVNECIIRLQEKYSSADSGIEITKVLGGWMLVPKRESFEFVKEKYGKKNEGRLSRAAIETLSIIAYSQPITRPEIQSIRHVNVDNMMRILLERNFIKEVGKKDVPGKPVMYGTTKEFLEFFHLQSIADLPQLEEKENERFVDLAR